MYFIVLLVLSNLCCILAADRGCITRIDLYAGTGGIADSQSNSDFKYEFHYKTGFTKELKAIALYDRPGDDMAKNQGDYWNLDGPEQCVKIEQVEAACFIKPLSGSDGWYVQDSITYGELDGDKTKLILISHNFAVDSWAEHRLPLDLKVTLPTTHIEHNNCDIQDQCIKNFYIMADTGDDYEDGTNSDVRFQINSSDYSLLVFYLPDLPGDDTARHKSDLWKISAEEAGITEGDCYKFGAVTDTMFKASGSDGWMIKNAMVTVQLDSGNFALLSGDRDLNKEIDIDGHIDATLTMHNECSTNTGLCRETPSS